MGSSAFIGPQGGVDLVERTCPELARSFLAVLIQELDAHCVGSLTVVQCGAKRRSEIFNGDPPHTPRGCIAQVWTVAEVLRAWKETESAHG